MAILAVTAVVCLYVRTYLEAPLLGFLHLLQHAALCGSEALREVSAPHDLRHCEHHLQAAKIRYTYVCHSDKHIYVIRTFTIDSDIRSYIHHRSVNHNYLRSERLKRCIFQTLSIYIYIHTYTCMWKFFPRQFIVWKFLLYSRSVVCRPDWRAVWPRRAVVWCQSRPETVW